MAQETSDMTVRHGEFVWSEIAATDADRTQAFYQKVVGWSFKHGDAAPGMDYREFSNGGERPIGGLYQIDPAWFGGNPPPAHWLIYVGVDDVDASAEFAKSLGGNVHKVMDIPNVGRMAIIQDPTGAMIATFNPNI